jgi:hypothetical protein
MYVSEHTKDVLIKKFGDKNGHIKQKSNDHRLYTLTFRTWGVFHLKPHTLYISCGDYCFPNYYRNKNFTIGVLRRRWIMKQVIDMCMETTIGREYKLDQLLES